MGHPIAAELKGWISQTYYKIYLKGTLKLDLKGKVGVSFLKPNWEQAASLQTGHC